MLLKYFYDDNLAHASYLVGCQATGEALVVDPGRDVDLYLRAAAREGLRLAGAVETHIHADFVSGARELAERAGVRLYLSAEGGEDWQYGYADQYDHTLLRDGDSFMVGNIRLEALHTPGHTPEHLSYILTDTAGADRPMGIFSGDFVFVGSVGRPDLLEKAAGQRDTAVAAARDMFHSLQRFRDLPDYLQVWPAHGAGSACGKGLGAIPSSTVGYEKLFNPALAIDDEDAFVDFLLDDQPEVPPYFAVMKQVNRDGPRVLHGLPKPEELQPADLPPLLADREIPVVDARSPGSYATGHLPGTINIPAGMLAGWAGWLLPYDRPFYLIIAPDRVGQAARDLAYIGLDNLAGFFPDTAVETLAAAGHYQGTFHVATPREIAGAVQARTVAVVDVRAESEYEEGHIPGAQHIHLGYLAERAGEIVNGRPIVVQCQTGLRSAIGASILLGEGFDEVINLAGGFRDWEAAGLPVER